ncbi:fungal specific transcription factor domain-containing protein [Apiospora arundinis]
MYPVIQIEHVINHVKFLCSWKDAVKKNFGQPTQGQGDGIADTKSLLLKIVLCIGLVIEEHGTSERADRLFESMRSRLERMLITDPSDVANLPILALVAGYRFLTNDEILSWRIIGQVARHCIELGLHRRETIMRIKDESERRDAIHTFWTAYILDRRWSFGTGLPYVLQDGDIDSQLPGPDEHPFLHAMISYSQLGAQVWEYVRHFDRPVDLRPVELEHLDAKIKQWYTNAPADAQLELPDWESMPRHFIPATYLKEAMTCNDNKSGRIFDSTKCASGCIPPSQVFYHQFLSSAIAVLFLASCHAPLNFSSSCRDEFYMALELVKDLSSKSDVSRRLWRTIASLKEVAPRLGLAQDEDPHSSAALTMAGLATGQHMATAQSQSPHKAAPSYPRAAPPSQPQQPPSATSSPAVPPNGWQISNEMSKIFEGYMGMNGYDERANSAGPTAEDEGPPSTPFGVGVDKPGSVYQHFRDMF